MKAIVFKLMPSMALTFLFAICGAQTPQKDSSSESEAYSQRMAERATQALLAARKIDNFNTGEITNLIIQKRFEEFEKRSKGYEEQFLKDPLYESPLFKLYQAIDTDSNHLFEKLDEWVKTRPSYISYGARGICKVKLGWIIRGDKYIEDTPPDHLYGMHVVHEEAKADLLKAIELNPRFSPAYCSLLDIEMANGNTMGTKSILDKAVQSIPETYYVRYIYIGSLRPRWGGTFEQMWKYVNSLDKAAQINPRIWSLKAEFPAELGQIAWAAKDFMSAIQYYTEAISYGERMSFLKSRGRLYMLVGQDALALEDFMKYKKYEDSDRVVNAYITSLTAKLGMGPLQKQ